MKKIAKITIWILILLFFGGNGIVFYVFHSSFWKNITTNYLSKQIASQYNLVLTIDELNGSPLGNIHVHGISLSTGQDTKILTIDEINLRYGLVHFLFKKGEVSYLRIHAPQLSYPASFDTLKKYMSGGSPKGRNTSLFFHTVEVTDLLIQNSDSAKSKFISSDYLTGSFGLHPDSISLVFEKGRVGFSLLENEILFDQTRLLLVSDSLAIQNCRMINESTRANLSGYILLDSTVYGSIENNIENFVFSERFVKNSSLFTDNDFLNLKGNIIVSGSNIQADYRFSGVFKNNKITEGVIQGFFHNGQFDFSKVSCKAGDQSFSTTLNGDLSNGLTASVLVDRFDLNGWQIIKPHTSLNGELTINAIGQLSNPDTVFADFLLHDISFDTLHIDSVNASFLLAKGDLEIIDTAYVRFEKTDIKIEGICNLDSNTIDSRVYFSSDSMDIFAELARVDQLQGRLEGFLEATGRLSSPDFRGWLRGKNFGVSGIYFEDAIARFGFMNIQEKRFGDIFIEANNGKTPFLDEIIPLTSMIVRFDGDTSIVRSLRVVGEDMNIEIQGKIVKFTDLFFDRINVYREGNTLTNIDPIYISLNEDTISLAEVRFALNKGMVILSGTSVNNRIQSAIVNIRDLNIDPINAYLKGARGVSGVLSGLVTFVDSSGAPSVYSRIDIEKANVVGKAFNRVRLESKVADNQITLENILFEDNEKGYINGFGAINCHYPVPDSGHFIDYSDLVNIQLQFDNFDFSTLGTFILPKLPKDGKLFGGFVVSNTVGSPVFDYDLNLMDPVLDRLTGYELQAKGVYNNHKLEFTNLHLRDEDGTSSGSGYLPFHFSFKPMLAVFEKDSSMYMNFTLHSKALEFLSRYNDNIESIEGEYDLALSISGTPRDPIRSGNIIAKNGVVRINSLENPVTGVTGSAVLTDNILEIVSLDGFMLKPLTRSRFDRFKRNLRKYTMDILFPPTKSPDEPNVSISGKIDLSTFFKPVFNIQVEGDEIYVRTLLAEQEGVLNGTFSMVGGDTLSIDGEVDINEFIIRNEFQTSEPMFEEAVRRKGGYSTIILHTIIPGNLYLRNSQLDCELEGEMWIIKNGSEPYRFSGTLDIRKGKFYYYGWEFDVVQGSIIFDPTEFNPSLDIEARVDLASYTDYGKTSETASGEDYVTVKLSGDMQNPSLVFDSNNKYNESDILLFLSRTQLGTDDPLNQDRMTDGAKNVFSMYFERQLERRIGQISGLDEFELRTSGDLFANQQPGDVSVALGQKLAPNLYFKYERSLSQIEPMQLFGIEYRLSRNFSVTGEVEQDGSFRINYLYKYRY